LTGSDAALLFPGFLLPSLLFFGFSLGMGFLLWDGYRQRQKEIRLLRSGIVEIDRMTGSEFEAFLAVLFAKEGYAVRRVGRSGDFGGDLVLLKDGGPIVVQAKRYKGFVGVRAVQEAVGAKGYYRCDTAWVITNSRFTPAAIELARANDVELFDRDRLVKRLLQGNPSSP
jgi:restriction system protein